jgi:hypothetical protein
MLTEAMQYLGIGYSIMPIGDNKKPLIGWEEFQDRKAEPKEIVEWWRKYPAANVGIITGSISKIFVVDFDSNDARSKINEHLPAGFETVEAKTPKGHHMYFCYDNMIKNSVGILPSVDIRGEGGYVVAPPSALSHGTYSWINDPFSMGIKMIPDPLKQHLFHSSHSQARGGAQNHRVNMSLGFRDNSLYRIALALTRNGLAEYEIIDVLSAMAQHMTPPYGINSDEDVKAKVYSAMIYVQKQDLNLSQDVRDWIKANFGVFHVGQVTKELGIVNRNQRQQVANALKRFSKEGLLEAYGNKSGTYRIVETEHETIHWKRACTTPYDITLPFGLTKLVNIYPGAIIMIAGETNTGKTGLLYNIIHANQNTHKVFLFNSESSPQEMKSRFQNFKNIKIDDWDFEARVWKHNADIIEPDGLNIIDYIDMGAADSWKIGACIDEIHKKLKKGIAICAIQKKAGERIGRGGQFTLDRPRLYLATHVTDQHNTFYCEIVKAKDYIDKHNNPNGKRMYYGIINGCEIQEITTWRRPHTP